MSSEVALVPRLFGKIIFFCKFINLLTCFQNIFFNYFDLLHHKKFFFQIKKHFFRVKNDLTEQVVKKRSFWLAPPSPCKVASVPWASKYPPGVRVPAVASVP
jgi:hypothetical protein